MRTITRDYIQRRLENIRLLAAEGRYRDAREQETSLYAFALGVLVCHNDPDVHTIAELALSSSDVIRDALKPVIAECAEGAGKAAE